MSRFTYRKVAFARHVRKTAYHVWAMSILVPPVKKDLYSTLTAPARDNAMAKRGRHL
jgi:hypothetical protein